MRKFPKELLQSNSMTSKKPLNSWILKKQYIWLISYILKLKFITIIYQILKGRPVKMKTEHNHKKCEWNFIFFFKICVFLDDDDDQGYEGNSHDYYYFSKKTNNYKPRHKVDYNRRGI